MRRPEEALHRACCQLLAVYQQRGLLAFAHPANGGYRTRGEAGILKALGLVAGVPDLLLWLPDGRTCAVELKAGSKPLTAPQLRWHDTMAALGHEVHVCRSIDDLEAVLRSHGVPAVGTLDQPKHDARKSA
jgi:hypothetical protein